MQCYVRLPDGRDFVIVLGQKASMVLEPNYIVVDGQTFSKAKLGWTSVYKLPHRRLRPLLHGGQYELIDTTSQIHASSKPSAKGISTRFRFSR